MWMSLHVATANGFCVVDGGVPSVSKNSIVLGFKRKRKKAIPFLCGKKLQRAQFFQEVINEMTSTDLINSSFLFL